MRVLVSEWVVYWNGSWLAKAFFCDMHFPCVMRNAVVEKGEWGLMGHVELMVG